jgi:hypothetical protein
VKKEDIENLRAMGLDIETVGELLGDTVERAAPVLPPIREGQAPFPEPGIYFGMSDEVYHAIHACSTSGLKHLSVSSMDYWANSLLNPDREIEEKAHFNLGKAIHCFVLEGEQAYLDRYVVDIDKASFVDEEGKSILLETTDQIKARLAELGHKPVSKGLEDATRAARKEDWITQLLEVDPDAPVWERMVTQFHGENLGKQFIDARTDHRIRIAAKMILAHPEIAKTVQGGYPEVAVFWFCPVTGTPMKCKFDYLKMRAIVDLKSFGNKGLKPIDRAIETAIANYRYNLQHVIYVEAAMEARHLIREHGTEAIHIEDEARLPEITDWCFKWASQREEPGFIFVFQQMGVAPVTRGKIMPTGTVFSVTKSRAEMLRRKWVESASTYGSDPWLDIVPIDEIEDEAIPLWATEL